MLCPLIEYWKLSARAEVEGVHREARPLLHRGQPQHQARRPGHQRRRLVGPPARHAGHGRRHRRIRPAGRQAGVGRLGQTRVRLGRPDADHRASGGSPTASARTFASRAASPPGSGWAWPCIAPAPPIRFREMDRFTRNQLMENQFADLSFLKPLQARDATDAAEVLSRRGPHDPRRLPVLGHGQRSHRQPRHRRLRSRRRHAGPVLRVAKRGRVEERRAVDPSAVQSTCGLGSDGPVGPTAPAGRGNPQRPAVRRTGEHPGSSPAQASDAVA